MTDDNHMRYLSDIATDDCEVLQEKERTYGSSWKKRGGVGAFMMLARKWDRLENVCRTHGWDVIEAARRENFAVLDGSVREQVADLRRYLLLLEAEMVAQDIATPIGDYRV